MPPFLKVFLQNRDMTHLTGNERAQYIQGMFNRIAPHYDLMNRLMTFGQDRHWRRETIKIAKLPPGGNLLLDLGGGTGDLGLEAHQSNPSTVSVEADFTLEMMRIGRERTRGHRLHWSAADALVLPFPDDTFDAVVSGFLLRNVVDLSKTLKEQYRVIKSGGRDMHKIIPLLGIFISGQGYAYKYLTDSSEGFLSAEELAAHMAAAGFGEIGFEKLNFGTIAIHWGEK